MGWWLFFLRLNFSLYQQNGKGVWKYSSRNHKCASTQLWNELHGHRITKTNSSFCYTWQSHSLPQCMLVKPNGWWPPPNKFEGMMVASMASISKDHFDILLLEFRLFLPPIDARAHIQQWDPLALFTIRSKFCVVSYNLGLLVSYWSFLRR